MTATRCDGHDAPAAFEAHWRDLSDPRDPRGASTAFCRAPACRARVLADVARHGDLVDVEPVDPGHDDAVSDESPVPGPTGRPQLMAERCTSCVFRPGNPMFLEPGRLAELVERNVEAGAMLTCHQTLSYGSHPEVGQAACRGFFDAYGDGLLSVRLVRMVFGGFDEVTPPRD